MRWPSAMFLIALPWMNIRLQAIENLHVLRQSKSKWDERYAGILDELDQPELLYLAILLHDTGKAVTSSGTHPGKPGDRQRRASSVWNFRRPTGKRSCFSSSAIWTWPQPFAGTSSTRARWRQFAESIGSPDRLKMLCLFTYADIKAVNPEALTPWKAEDLWQLYIGTANYLNRTVDERVHADANDEVLNHLRSLAPAAGKNLQTFLDGLPRRYLRTHPVDEILRHFEMANRLGQDSGAAGA